MKNIKRMSYGAGFEISYKELCRDVQKYLIDNNKCFIEQKLSTLIIGSDEK